MRYVTVKAIDSSGEIFYQHSFALDTVPEAVEDPRKYLYTIMWAIGKDAIHNDTPLDRFDIEKHEVESAEDYYAAIPCAYNLSDREVYPHVSEIAFRGRSRPDDDED